MRKEISSSLDERATVSMIALANELGVGLIEFKQAWDDVQLDEILRCKYIQKLVNLLQVVSLMRLS